MTAKIGDNFKEVNLNSATFVFKHIAVKNK